MRYWFAVVAVALMFVSAASAESQVFLGGGVHYWRSLDDIADTHGIEEDGLAYMVSLQLVPTRMLRLEGNVEIFPDGFAGSTDTAYSPQAYIILGSSIYAGLGVGTVYSSDFEDDFTDAFYVIRAGLNLELFSNVYLDINANYHFMEWEQIEDIDDELDTDTVTLGAMLRLGL